ncbi:hypothetical protein ACQP2U_43335 (plasmid) [Nocardia sp. CA-084685]|uniref:hypothetical protein n=1 Tax=Nocardia sp. CA-084685 TaxID=3239970 RepID=UPI003D95FC0D
MDHPGHHDPAVTARAIDLVAAGTYHRRHQLGMHPPGAPARWEHLNDRERQAPRAEATHPVTDLADLLATTTELTARTQQSHTPRTPTMARATRVAAAATLISAALAAGFGVIHWRQRGRRSKPVIPNPPNSP